MKKIIVITLGLVILTFAAVSAEASGLGFYGSSGSGDSDIDVGPFWWLVTNSTVSSKADLSTESVGLVFDTNLSEDRLFNYRLEIGKGTYSWEIPGGSDTELKQVVMTHDFGFGILRNRAVRLWLGPEIRLTRINDDANGNDYDLMGFGFGLALGLNININGPVTIAIKAGALNQTVNGDVTYSDMSSDDVSSDDTVSFVSAALMFRLGESF